MKELKYIFKIINLKFYLKNYWDNPITICKNEY